MAACEMLWAPAGVGRPYPLRHGNNDREHHDYSHCVAVTKINEIIITLILIPPSGAAPRSVTNLNTMVQFQ